ncbi:MAG: DMT family transporter [Alphaproteobacteria bacterium]
MVLQASVVGIVLVAAVVHATWNALAKAAHDKLHMYLVSNVVPGLIGGVALLFLPPPDRSAWLILAISGPMQVVYTALLFGAYRIGDLSQVYPIIRGLSPMFVALGALVFAGEALSHQQYVGIAIVCVGMASLAFGHRRADRRFDWRPLAYCVMCAAMIATYTVMDGIGVRRSGSPFAYACWLFVAYGVGACVCYPFLSRWRVPVQVARRTGRAILVGVGMVTAYGLVIYALSLGAMAPISALRETSVFMAAVIGAVFLGEPFGRRRIVAAAIVTIGLIVLNIPFFE